MMHHIWRSEILTKNFDVPLMTQEKIYDNILLLTIFLFANENKNLLWLGNYFITLTLLSIVQKPNAFGPRSETTSGPLMIPIMVTKTIGRKNIWRLIQTQQEIILRTINTPLFKTGENISIMARVIRSLSVPPPSSRCVIVKWSRKWFVIPELMPYFCYKLSTT